MQIFGVIKETGVDDEGLIEFQRDYFPFAIYRDPKYTFYRVLGDRKVGLGEIVWNPLKLISIAWEAYTRLLQKNVTGNTRGEGFVQGGILFFQGSIPRAAYLEQTFMELPIYDILCAAVWLQNSE